MYNFYYFPVSDIVKRLFNYVQVALWEWNLDSVFVERVVDNLSCFCYPRNIGWICCKIRVTLHDVA